MKRRPAIYARVSGPGDTRTASIETQIEEVCRKLGVEVPPEDIFIEKYTGKLLHERPVLSRLRERIRAGYYDTVGIYCLDRLSRGSTAHLAVIFEEAERFGCSIVSATEEIDSTPEGELLRNIRGYVAQVERIKILERTQRGTRRMLDQGIIICSGKARLGYRYDKDIRQRVIQPAEAEIVKRIFALAVGGVAIRRICHILDGEQIPTPRECAGQKKGLKGWSKSVVLKILRDPSYYGAPMSWGKTRVVGRRPNGRAAVEVTLEEDRISLGEATPVIIERELWELAQLTINRRKTYSNAVNSYKQFRMLAGMVFCRCGSSMTTQKAYRWKKRGWYYLYTCLAKRESRKRTCDCDNKSMQIEQVEESVWEQVVNLAQDQGALQRAIEKARGDDAGLELELAARRQLITDAEATAARLVDALSGLTDPIVQRPLRAKLAALSKQAEEHRRAVVDLESRLAQCGQASSGLAYVLAMFQGTITSVMTETTTEPFPLASLGRIDRLVLTAEGEPEITPEVKRKVLEALGCRVTLDNKQIRVELNIPLASQNCVSGERGPPAEPGASAARSERRRAGRSRRQARRARVGRLAPARWPGRRWCGRRP